MLKKRQFFPAITTTKGADWREMIREIDELGLCEIAIFPTCLGKQERKELYNLLETTNLKSIPLVHLRGDMALEELDYLAEKYRTKLFNIHTPRRNPLVTDFSRYKKQIYIENGHPLFTEKELDSFTGICLDFSHLENDRRLNKEVFQGTIEMFKKYPIGWAHVSAVMETPHVDIDGYFTYHEHRLKNFSELDYLKNYPLNYFPNFIAMELTNPLKEQQKAIDYILKILNS